MEHLCNRCNTVRPIKEFYKRENGKFKTPCIPCRLQLAKITAIKNKLKKYNLSQEEYDELISKQNNSCAICKKPQEKRKRKLSIDHNHKTGKVRGLLCYNCNITLGYIKESKEILLEMIKYIEKENNV